MPLSYFRRPLAVLTLLYVVALVLLRACGLFRVDPPPRLRPFANLRSVAVEGVVASGFSPKRPGDRYWIRMDRTEYLAHAPVKIMAYLPRDDPETQRLRPGHRVRLEGRLRRPRWARNPGAFDEQAFLDQRGAAFVFHARKVRIVQNPMPWRWAPWAAGEAAHRSLHDYLVGRFPGETSSILEGLLVGFKGPMPPALSRAIQDSGVMHLLTPSGAKITLVVGWAVALGLLLGLRPGMRLLAAALASTCYLLVVGPEPPYTRAYLMSLAMCACYVFDRESGGFQALVLSALATLLVSPRALFSAGFQLTYLAMLGILFILPTWTPPSAWPAVLRLAARVLSISFAVQLMLWPTFAGIFGRGSLVGLLVNVIMVPASGLIAGTGFLAWGASLSPVPGLERPLGWAAGAMAQAFKELCVFASGLPGAALSLRPMSATEIAVYYLAALALLVLPRKRPAALLAGSAVLVWAASLGCSRLSGESLRVHFLCQRKGRAALAALPGGGYVLIDAGATASVMRDTLRRLGVRRLESVWVTGTDRSRWKGLRGLPALVEIGEVRLPPGALWERRWQRTVMALADAGVPVRHLRPGGVRLSHGNVDIDWKEGRAVVSGGGGGVYCIMTAPTRTVFEECSARRTFSASWEGAVRVVSDGEKVAISTQREGRAFGRAFP